MRRVLTVGLVSFLAITGFAVPGPASGLSVAQHPLPAYKCGASSCPSSSATALMGEPGKVLAAGVEGGSHATDVYTEVQLPGFTLTAGPAGPAASALAPGLDGHPWLLDQTGAAFGVLDANGHSTTTLFAFPGNEIPRGLAAGLGAAWVGGSGLERIEGGKGNKVVLGGFVGEVRGLAVGPAESAWATRSDGVIVQLTNGGEVIEHAVGGGLEGIAVGPDGNVWFTDWRGFIGRLTPSGQIQEFPIPVHSPPYDQAGGHPFPVGITSGPGDLMYFTDPGDNAVGTVTMAGTVTEYEVPAGTYVAPRDIASVGNEVVFDEGQIPALGTINLGGAQSPLATPPSIETIEAWLRQLARDASAQSGGTFSRGQATTLAVTAPETGSLSLTWTAEVPATPQGKTRGKQTKRKAMPAPPERVVIARSEQAFALSEARLLRVSLSMAGRALLGHNAKRGLRTTVQASFSGYWSGRLEANVSRLLR